jgi:hypothetical protein
MAKAFFRWLRGELNGFYVTNINGALNESTKDIKDFLSEFKAQQFEKGKITSKNLYGLGKFAGISYLVSPKPNLLLHLERQRALLLTDLSVLNVDFSTLLRRTFHSFLRRTILTF